MKWGLMGTSWFQLNFSRTHFIKCTYRQFHPPLAGGYFHYLMPITAAIVVLRTVLDIINGVF
jgi:hypothetical protein